ncbi:MAG: diguanylate cyclase domain-containing protein [Micavibrio sp.]
MHRLTKLYSEYALIIMIMLIGIAFSGWLAHKYQQSLVERTLGEFKGAAQDRLQIINDKINNNDIVLRSLEAFFKASNNVTRDEFATFTQQILRDYPYINTLEWIPLVTAAERKRYESSTTPENRLKITELDNQEQIIPAAIRDLYYPIFYAESLASDNTSIKGLDLASRADRREALLKAKNEHQMQATGRIHLLQSKEKMAGVVFYQPIVLYTQKEGREYQSVSGFVGSVIPFVNMIDSALSSLSYAGVNIVISDLSATSEAEKILYIRSTRLKKIPDEEILDDYKNPLTLKESRVLDVGGRKWQMAVISARGFYETKTQKETALIFGFGALFTIVICTYMAARLRENDRISQEVEQRTQELSQAQKQTEMILLSTHEGIIGLNDQGRISFCNKTTCQMLQYTKRELIGQSWHELAHYKKADGTTYPAEASPIIATLQFGQPCNVNDEVFWNKNGEPLQIEYSASPLIEGGEIVGTVIVFRDIAERRALEDKLKQMARYDQLTGLANRSMLMEHLKGSLARAERSKTKVGMIYMDLNGFKPVNDTLGHAAGDIVLKKFAGCLREVVRDTDIPARVGGDEFTILMDNLGSEEDSLKLIERLRKRLSEPFEIAGQKFNIGASIGVAFYPDDATDLEELITCADSAMYKAKKNKDIPYVLHRDV